jgi:hypothetical protein
MAVDPAAGQASHREKGRPNQAGRAETIQKKRAALEEFIHKTEGLLQKVVPEFSLS